jgi:hypothetical protein
MVHQEQNAESARQEAARRLQAPVQPDQVEGKIIDPNARREEEKRKKKRHQKENAAEHSIHKVIEGRGRVIDYSA